MGGEGVWLLQRGSVQGPPPAGTVMPACPVAIWETEKPKGSPRIDSPGGGWRDVFLLLLSPHAVLRTLS